MVYRYLQCLPSICKLLEKQIVDFPHSFDDSFHSNGQILKISPSLWRAELSWHAHKTTDIPKAASGVQILQWLLSSEWCDCQVRPPVSRWPWSRQVTYACDFSKKPIWLSQCHPILHAAHVKWTIQFQMWKATHFLSHKNMHWFNDQSSVRES